MRDRPATRDAMLVAVTGWNQSQDRQRSRAAGFDHHFAKPVDLEALTRLLARPRRDPPGEELPRSA
jgi:CheY-like chemotaxis protein